MVFAAAAGALHAAQRKRFRVKRFLERVWLLSKCLGALACCVALVWGGVHVYWLLQESEYFRVRTIQVTGQSPLTRRQMLRILDLPANITLLQLDVTRLGARLERHPLVHTVTIRRQFPETLQIRIQERTPYLTVAAGADHMVVDADGVVLRPAKPGRDRHLPQLKLEGERALAAGMRLQQADIQRAIALLRTYHASSVAATMRVASLVVEKSGASRWRFASYPFPIRFGEGRIGTQLERLPPVLRYIRERGLAVRVLDLSYQKRAVVMPVS